MAPSPISTPFRRRPRRVSVLESSASSRWSPDHYKKLPSVGPAWHREAVFLMRGRGPAIYAPRSRLGHWSHEGQGLVRPARGPPRRSSTKVIRKCHIQWQPAPRRRRGQKDGRILRGIQLSIQRVPFKRSVVRGGVAMKYAALVSTLVLIAAVMGGMVNGIPTVVNAQSTFDITTLAGKVASVNSTAGLQIRFSGFIEEQADISDQAPNPEPFTAIAPIHVLSSPFDGTSVTPPAVTVNRDNAGAPQNETTIAVDPNNPRRVVAAANDYVTRTWTCFVSGTPCSRLGDAYSGTYYSNDGGATWCYPSTGPSDLGTLIPGVEHLTGGPYDAGGDPALTFDSRGNVYYAGLGFDRTAPPNTVAVNKGTFDASGKLTWGPPTFINQTTSPAIFNDKEWIAADHYASSPFRDRVYVSWTRFIFNPHNGAYVQSPIAFAYSKDGGA